MSHGVAMFDMDETITRLSLGDTLDDHWWADEQLRNEGKSIRRQFVPFGTGGASAFGSRASMSHNTALRRRLLEGVGGCHVMV